MNIHSIDPSDRIPRHEHRVRAFSRDYDLITHLGDGYAAQSKDSEALARWVVERFSVPMPDLAFNRRRRHDTGQCWPPRWRMVELHGADRLAAWEGHRGRMYPAHGRIRLGTTTTVRTLAHELGHHLVHHLDPASTPAHGRVWVGRFDDAISTIAEGATVIVAE